MPLSGFSPAEKAAFRDALAALTRLSGISGHEAGVARHLAGLLEPLADRVELDPLGNVYAYRAGGNGPHLMVSAHSDEIGALVAAIEEDGFLRLQPVGGASPELLLGRKVLVGDRPGVIGAPAGHLRGDNAGTPGIEELYVDVGASSRAEAGDLGVRVGDQIVWQSELEPLAQPDRVAGKGIDNRLGCLLVIELLRALQGSELPGPLTAVIAVQEEVGLKGARLAAERVRPQGALVLDTTPCTDTPDGRAARTFQVRLGGGPVFQVSSGSHAGGFIMQPAVRDFLIEMAGVAGVPYQLAAFAYGDTDAGSIYTSAGGIVTAVATIPRRYSHSPVEVLDLNDALATLALAREVVNHAAEFPARGKL